MGKRGKLQTLGQFKREGESRNPQLDSNNKFYVLARMKAGISNSEEIKEKNRKTVLKEKEEKEKKQERKQESKKKVETRKAGEEGLLREITVIIELERIDT